MLYNLISFVIGILSSMSASWIMKKYRLRNGAFINMKHDTKNNVYFEGYASTSNVQFNSHSESSTTNSNVTITNFSVKVES